MGIMRVTDGFKLLPELRIVWVLCGIGGGKNRQLVVRLFGFDAKARCEGAGE